MQGRPPTGKEVRESVGRALKGRDPNDLVDYILHQLESLDTHTKAQEENLAKEIAEQEKRKEEGKKYQRARLNPIVANQPPLLCAAGPGGAME